MAEIGPTVTGQPELPSGGPPPAPVKKSKGPLLIVLAALLVLLAIVATVLYIWLGQKDRGLIAANPEEAAYIEQYNLRRQQAADIIKSGANPVYSQVFDYTVNMKNGQNMLRFAFRALLFDSEARDFLAEIRPAIDDTLLGLLQQLNPEDLRSRAGVEVLKRHIHRTMNEVYPASFIDQSRTKDRMPIKDILIVQYYIN